MSLDAMKQALEALEFLELENFVELDKSLNVGPTHGRKAILALRAAIEHAERPMTHSADCWRWHHACARAWIERNKPTAPRQWQGLTDEELREAYLAIRGNEWCLGGISDAESFYEAIEAKLKEKNG